MSVARIFALGVSHKTAPLELRERLALTEGRAVSVLGELVGAPEIAEAAAISTGTETSSTSMRAIRLTPSPTR